MKKFYQLYLPLFLLVCSVIVAINIGVSAFAAVGHEGTNYKMNNRPIWHTEHQVFAGGADFMGMTILSRIGVIDINTTGVLHSIPDDVSGGVIFVSSSGDDPVNLELPADVDIGWSVWIIDNDATAAADVHVWPSVDSGEAVGAAGAGGDLVCTSDAIGQSILLLKTSELTWTSLAVVGTWANGGNENPGGASTLSWPDQ